MANSSGRSGADAPSGLRPFGAEPTALSQAEPLVPNAKEAATGLCEQFIGEVLIRREFEEAVPGDGVWHRLAKSPVFTLEADGAEATDIDSRGDAWVRSNIDTTAKFTAGMAETFDGLPEPLKLGIERLARHIASRAKDEPPAAVTALWRPYRRLRLS
jgi:hypothetical protein